MRALFTDHSPLYAATPSKRTERQYIDLNASLDLIVIRGRKNTQRILHKGFVGGFGRWECQIRTPHLKLWFPHQFRGLGVLFGSLFAQKQATKTVHKGISRVFETWECEIRIPRCKLWFPHQVRAPGVLSGSFPRKAYLKEFLGKYAT